VHAGPRDDSKKAISCGSRKEVNALSKSLGKKSSPVPLSAPGAKKLGPQEQRILSVYDDEPICLDCKKREEGRSDYGEVSRKMIGQCMADVEQRWGSRQASAATISIRTNADFDGCGSS